MNLAQQSRNGKITIHYSVGYGVTHLNFYLYLNFLKDIKCGTL